MWMGLFGASSISNYIRKSVKYHVRRSSIELLSRLLVKTCQTVGGRSLFQLVICCCVFYLLLCILHLPFKMKKQYLLMHMLLKVVFCFVGLCCAVLQAVWSAEAKEIKYFSLSSNYLLVLFGVCKVHVCVPCLSVAKHLLSWAHFPKFELNYRFLILSTLQASRLTVKSMVILSQRKKVNKNTIAKRLHGKPWY